MRWHPGVEHPEVILERCRLQAARPQRIFEVLAPVKPLSTRRNLEPVEEQVETGCAPRRERVRIEGTGGERESEDEHGRDPLFTLGELAELTLGIGVEVVDTDPDSAFNLSKMCVSSSRSS